MQSRIISTVLKHLCSKWTAVWKWVWILPRRKLLENCWRSHDFCCMEGPTINQTSKWKLNKNYLLTCENWPCFVLKWFTLWSIYIASLSALSVDSHFNFEMWNKLQHTSTQIANDENLSVDTVHSLSFLPLPPNPPTPFLKMFSSLKHNESVQKIWDNFWLHKTH